MSFILNPYAFGGGLAPTFPVYLSATTYNLNTAATSHSVPMPAVVAAGDMLIVQFHVPNNTSPTFPGGWTVMADVSGSAIMRSVWYYKVAAGTEGGTTITVTTASGKATAITHRIQAGTFHGATAPTITTVTANTATPDPPSNTPSWGAADTLWIACASFRSIGTVSVYPFSGTNTSVSTNAVANSDSQCASCWVATNTASQDPGTFTRSITNTTTSATIAIRPV